MTTKHALSIILVAALASFSAPKNSILGSVLGGDVDAAGALAVAHALMDNGERS